MGNGISISICARTDTGKFRDGDYSHMLSLLDPQGGYDGIVIPSKTRHLGRLMFNDLDDIEVRSPKFFSYTPPSKADVLRIMEFFRHLRDHQGSGILIHCEAGISRSAAAAIVGLCAVGVSPQAAFEYVIGLNEMGLPNRRMLRFADEILGGNGELIKIAEAQRKDLFTRFAQPDPIEALRNELEQMSRGEVTREFMRQWAQAIMRNLKALIKFQRLKAIKPSRFIKSLTVQRAVSQK